MAQVQLSGIAKTFGKVTALDAMDLTIDDGELVCLLGPSGSGKSTLLRIIGGFEMPSEGTIAIDGVDVTDLPPERRPTAMVFQSHALWSHMTVFGNIAFGLKLRHLPKAEIRERVEKVLDLVGLSGYGARLPSQLSGGQQQRVALARSLVVEPKILLLDEPFASLDQHLRERLREEVRDIQQRLGITAVFVTHGQDEALAISDRIVVLADGRMQQVGRPGEIYAEPKTAFVAGFIGAMNMLDGTLADGEITASGLKLPAEGSGPAKLAIRPEDIELAEPAEGRTVTVRRMIDFGAHVVIDGKLADGTHLRIQTDKAIRVSQGDQIGIRVESWTVFTDGGEPRRYRSDTVRSFRGARYA